MPEAITAEAVTARAAEVANADAITAEAVTARAAEVANAGAITAEAVTARAAEVANADAITAEAVTARAAETANATSVTNIVNGTTDLSNASVTMTGGDLSTVVTTLGAGISRADNKADAMADFTNSGAAVNAAATDINTVVLKAIDASNAEANGQALGDVKTGADALADESATGNVFLSFFRNLFGN